MDAWIIAALALATLAAWDFGRRWVNARTFNESTLVRHEQFRQEQWGAINGGLQRVTALEQQQKAHNDEFRQLANKLNSPRAPGAPRGIGRIPG